EDARKVRRAELIQVGQRRPKRRPASGIVALAPSPWRHIEPGDGNRRRLIAEQTEQEIRKSLLALADDGQVIVRPLQHPDVVRRNLRAAEDDTRPGQVTFYFLGNPECALNVPDIAREPDHPWPALNDGADESAVPECVGGSRRQNADVVERAQSFLLG